MKKEIIILGVGHNTPVYIELAELLGYSIAGLYHYRDEMTGKKVCGFTVAGCNDRLFAEADLSRWHFGLSMGSNDIRSRLAAELRKRGGRLPTMAHPAANVSRYARLEDGVVVHANATVQPNVEVARDAVVSFNSGVIHDASIGEAAYVAGGAIVGACAEIQSRALLGIGSVVVSGKVKTVGHDAIVGAGAVVTRDVEPYAIVAGNPARVIGRTDTEGRVRKR